MNTTPTTMTMTNKKELLRMCVVTREIKNVNELIRIVKTPSGIILIEKDEHLPGRGAYISKDIEIIKLAKKRKSLNKALRTNVPEEIYDELLLAIR